jgi:hypothetical protein
VQSRLAEMPSTRTTAAILGVPWSDTSRSMSRIVE